MNKFLNNFYTKFLTISRGNVKNTGTREISPPPIREINKPITDSFACPYCSSKNFVRRGFRQKKMEKVQLYICQDCHKTFTKHFTKGKHYPLPTMFDAICIYNLGYSLEQTCKIINERNKNFSPLVKEGLGEIEKGGLNSSTLSNWLTETSDLCHFSRLRPYAIKKYSPTDMIVMSTLVHRQLYRYRFHRAKCELAIQDDFKNRRFRPLQEFLEMVPGECPHQYFQDGQRASETPLTFSKTQMIVRSKQNFATRLATFVLQSVKNRKGRHEALQKFMLANDTVTVATEVPVYITNDDIHHMQTQLNFEIFGDVPQLITGHIDFLQIRNGQIHILDYKPNASKVQPIEQLTLYAMALSRLTGLRLFEFKCAWFDEKDYFEFYPLHVLYKPNKNRRRKKVYTMEGTYQINQDTKKILNIKPI